MSKKDKLIKWLKENYKSLIGKIILVLFAFLVVFSQIKNCFNHLETDTSLSSQPTKRLHLDTNDNLVSDNLLYIADKEATTQNGVTYSIKNGVVILNGSSTITFNFEVYDITSLFTNGQTYFIKDFTNNENLKVFVGIRDTSNSSEVYFQAPSSFIYNGEFSIRLFFQLTQNVLYDNSTLSVSIVKGDVPPLSFEPYGLTYYSQSYIDKHYVSNEENEQQKETAYNNGYDKGLGVNLKSELIDLLDTNEIDGVYAYDSTNNIDYSINYFNSDDYIRVDNLSSKKGLIIQYKRTFNVDTLKFSIPSTDFIANDNWEYIYFKVYLYNSSIQSFTNLDVFTSDTTSSSIYINGTFNGKVSFDKIYIGFDFLTSISNTFESISMNSQVSHIYTDYYDTIFQLGYNEAVASGESFKNGYSEGYKDGEKAGIYQGQLMQTNFSLGDIMKSVISAPVEVLGITLDFDIPGTNINIFSIIRLVITCLVIAFAIKFLRG